MIHIEYCLSHSALLIANFLSAMFPRNNFRPICVQKKKCSQKTISNWIFFPVQIEKAEWTLTSEAETWKNILG